MKQATSSTGTPSPTHRPLPSRGIAWCGIAARGKRSWMRQPAVSALNVPGSLSECWQQEFQSPRTRYRQEAKVAQAVEDILAEYDVARWLKVQITPRICETYKQEGRGRPTKDTRYEKQIDYRFGLTCTVDQIQIERDRLCDGIFPLISNHHELTKCELLWAYKRQPAIENGSSDEVRLLGGAGVLAVEPADPIPTVRLFLRAAGGGLVGTGAASSHAESRAQDIAAVSRRTRLPLSDHPPGDSTCSRTCTAIRCRFLNERNGDVHRIVEAAAAVTQAARPACCRLRPLTRGMPAA